MTTAVATPEPKNAPRKLATIDCDVHPHFVHGINDLVPYMTEAWRRRMSGGHQTDNWAKELPASQFSIPKNVMYINSAGVMRRDTAAAGMIPSSDPDFVARQLLDEHAIDRAILVGGHALGLGALPDADLAAAIASAHNEWIGEVWLAADERYRASLIVAPQDPAQAAAEIDRVGDRPAVVQVHLPLTNILMGERHYYPIYETAERHGLPIAIHPNGTDAIYAKGPTLAGGTPTYYIEWHTALTQVFQANLLSILCHGVFEKFPGLKLVIAEGGFAWLVDVLWRLDRNWKFLRDEVPWLTRSPSEYVVEHVRFTTQPFVEPDRVEHLHALCEMIHAERTLLFSSDYPHWDFDNPRRALAALPEALHERVFGENARELYGDRLN